MNITLFFYAIILVIPLLLNITAIVIYRRVFRLMALLVVPFTTFATVVDLYSASQQGNLTGMVTILISGPALIVLGLLGIGNLAARGRSDQPERSGSVGSDGPTARHQRLRSMAWRVFRGALSGGVLVEAGLILFMISARLFLGRSPVPFLALLPIGGGLGMTGGALVAWITGKYRRNPGDSTSES